MNILYCGDENIDDGLIISILSLLKNVKEELHIYVFTMEIETVLKKFNPISDEIVDYLNDRVKQSNNKNFVKKVDVTDLFIEELPVENINTRFTPYCMLRLFADKIEDMPDRILYLDTDVICRLDCSEFYHQDINDYELAGVLDYYGKWLFRRNIRKLDYLNSGVLLLNLKKIKKTKLFENCRKLCIEKEMFMPDQSAINKLAKNKKILPRKYNEQRKLKEDTVFQHFTTTFRMFPWLHTFTVKPWQVDRMHEELNITEYDDILNEYLSIIDEQEEEKREPVKEGE